MNAGQKWLQLFFEILTYEVDHKGDGQLLSEGADRLVEKHPVAGRLFIVCAGAMITLHLANLYPDDRYDIMATKFWAEVHRRFR